MKRRRWALWRWPWARIVIGAHRQALGRAGAEELKERSRAPTHATSRCGRRERERGFRRSSSSSWTTHASRPNPPPPARPRHLSRRLRAVHVHHLWRRGLPPFGFVAGQAGLYCALLIVLASYAICLLTTLSLCALIADGDDRHRRGSVSDTGSPAKDPGVYAALRQAVGTPLGGALGLAFYLAFTVDVAFYIIGFAEMFSRAADVSSSIQIFPWNPPGSWVDTAVAAAALALLALVCACGVHVSARVSLLTLCVICACILASLACLLFPTDDALSGHTQFSLTTLANNSAPALEDFDGRGLSLMKMFTLTFPGFTGVLAGSNLSANLRTPTRSIAAGTLASLLFVLVTYAAICFVLAASVDRHVLKDPRVMIMDTAVATITGLPLGYVGVVCTTLSSALSYLLGAPRVLHAVVRDAPWPPLQRLLATDRSTAAAEPLRALDHLGLVRLIVLSGTLDLLSPLVSGVFLLAFTLINLVAFVAAASRRRAFATFKYHSRATALGFVLSFLAMVVSLSLRPPSPPPSAPCSSCCCGGGGGALHAAHEWRVGGTRRAEASASAVRLSTAVGLWSTARTWAAELEERLQCAPRVCTTGCEGARGGRTSSPPPGRPTRSAWTDAVGCARSSNAWDAAAAGDQSGPLPLPGARRASGVVLCAAELRETTATAATAASSDQPAGAAALGDDGSRVRLPDALRDRNGSESNVHGLCRLLFEPLAPRPAAHPRHGCGGRPDVGGVAATLAFFNPLLRPLLFVAMSRTLRRAASQFLSVIPAVAGYLI